MSQKFVIIDGSSLLYRAFYALPLLTTASGQYTNAVYGFITMLLKLLEEVKPDLVAVAFDKGKVTFRNDTYAEYKAHRKPTPIELIPQFSLVKEALMTFGISVLEEAGYEADDIIGTLATKACGAACDVLIVTGDRDALQLINDNTKVMLTKKGISSMEIFDDEAFIAKYGVTAKQLIDLKGLMGDTSDNIPGVPGVGEKTASKLISEFGTVENLLENIDKVAGKKLQEKLRENSELAVLSKKLATIICDMPLEFSLENFTYKPDLHKIKELFLECEFKSLINRVNTLFPGNYIEDNEVTEDLPDVQIVEDYEQIKQIIADVQNNGELIFNANITGKKPDLLLKGLALVYENQTVYIANNSKGWLELIKLFSDENIAKVTHDAKHIFTICKNEKIELKGLVFDTMLAAYLLEPTASEYPLVKLKQLYLEEYSTPPKTDEEPLILGWGANAIFALYNVLKQKLAESKLDKLYNEIELPLIEVLAAVEHNGIKVSVGYLQTMSANIAKKLEVLLAEIYHSADEEFNVNSPKQLGVILFEKLKLPIIKKTKTGYSTNAEVLEKLAGQHEIVDKILEYRMLAKLKSTYLDGMAGLVSANTGRIHTTFNQTVTATGRLSSSEPNLQNIPIRTEMGKKIREVFIPGEGYDYIMSADYSQVELRVLAHMSGDENLIEAFTQNQDIHTRTAAEVFELPMDEVTSELRSRAKAVNFGIVYGISDYGLSKDIGVSRKEAGQYIESYFKKYSGVKAFIDKVVSDAHHNGYVTTMFDRRRYLPDINSSNFNQRSFAERTAMNTPIQGSAADIIKKAMLDVYYALKAEKLQSRILLQVHDELVLEVTASEVNRVKQIVKQAMEQCVDLKVPLLVEVKMGINWAAAK